MQPNSFVTCTLVAAALTCASSGHAQPPYVTPKPYPAAVDTQLKVARDAQVMGDFVAANQAYDQALREAALAGGPAHAQAQVRLMQAQGIERWAASDASQATRLATAEALYKQVIAEGTAEQQRLARNNLGTLLLRRHAPAEALPVFQGIDLAADPEKRFAYEYNLGRALEQNSKPTDAFTHYLASIDAQPTFVPPREAAIGLLQTSSLSNRAVGDLCNLLLEKGQPTAAADVARTLLPKASSVNATQLLNLLARAWVTMSIDFNTFKRVEEPFLQSLSASGVKDQAQDVIRAMLDAGLPVVPDPLMGRRTFPGWFYEPDAKGFALFVKYAGDLYNPTSPRQALARYIAAWLYDHGNGESAVYAAMTIRDHPEVDPDHRVLNLLIKNIFDAKMSFIHGEDWPNSLRMHLELGNIFEQLGKWGPISDSHTAAYQYKAAVDDEARIRQKDKTFSPSPGLYAKLAQAYVHVNEPALAKAQYDRAIQVFEQSGRPQEAAAIRAQLQKISPP